MKVLSIMTGLMIMIAANNNDGSQEVLCHQGKMIFYYLGSKYIKKILMKPSDPKSKIVFFKLPFFCKKRESW